MVSGEPSMGQLYVLGFRGKIVKIEVKKRSDPSYSSTNAQITANLYGADGNCCDITNFDNPNYNDFEAGKVDIFEKATLLDCEDFDLIGLQSMTMKIIGTDGWLGEYLKIYLDNGGHYHCKIEAWVDDYLPDLVLDSNTCEFVAH